MEDTLDNNIEDKYLFHDDENIKMNFMSENR